MPGDAAAVTRVLVVDDDVDATELYASWLAPEFAVRTATDGGEALDRLDDSIDVVLVDRRMPGVSGEEVAADVRARDLGARVAIVSGSPPELDLIGMDVDDYVTKPVSRSDLIETVERLSALGSRSPRVREYAGLLRTRDALTRESSPGELVDSDRYRALEAEIEARRAALSDAELRAAEQDPAGTES